MQNYLEFEKPLAEIESKAAELRLMAEKSEDDVNVDAEAKIGRASCRERV